MKRYAAHTRRITPTGIRSKKTVPTMIGCGGGGYTPWYGNRASHIAYALSTKPETINAIPEIAYFTLRFNLTQSLQTSYERLN